MIQFSESGALGNFPNRPSGKFSESAFRELSESLPQAELLREYYLMPTDCAALQVGMRADLVDAVNVDGCRRKREDVRGLIQPSKSPLFLPAWVEAPGAHRAKWNGEMLPLQDILRRSCKN